MNTENRGKTGSLDLGEIVNCVVSSEASRHFGNAFREALLAMRYVVNAVIERQERKKEAKLQKVTIE
ncbi:MAG: hypothetical protein O7E52_29255 [Candidatus Poribacteria bacterium]|nr:hypothetical protein [Candidatus Poribacteria bacterium]